MSQHWETEEGEDLEEVELGFRAAWWLTVDQFGQCYATLHDRTWNAAIGCFSKVCQSGAPDSERERWKPLIQPDGSWRMP